MRHRKGGRKKNKAPPKPPSAAEIEWVQRCEREYDLHNTPEPPALVYLILITPPDTEWYYKIGYTSRNVEFRFNHQNSNIPSFVKVCESKFMSNDDARMLEKTLHGAFRKQRVIPLTRFDGWTECFKLNQDDVNWIKKVLTY